MTDEQEETLNKFLDDISCLNELKKWGSDFNIFDVLNIAKAEIRHSNVLAWLLDPKGNHGLGDSVLYNLLSEVLASNPDCPHRQTRLLLLNLKSFDVRREEGHIDILLVSNDEKFVIAIENKTFSDEHDNQLSRYTKYINDNFAGFDSLFIYLTPFGDESDKNKDWMPLSYDSIYQSTYKALEDNDGRVGCDIKAFINDYLEILRRDMMEDSELKNVCEKIYQKHREALELIYKNCDIGDNRYYKYIRETLAELKNEGKIIYEDAGESFYLEMVDKVLPRMNSNNSVWGTDRCYSFWLEIRWPRIIGHFELGRENLSDDQKNVQEVMIEYGHPRKKKNDTQKYKRIEGVVEKIKDDGDSPDDIKDATKKIVDKLIAKAAEIVKRIDNSNN